MPALANWIPLVLPKLPGCPDPFILDAVRDAAETFCRRTKLLRQSVDVQVSAGTAVYERFQFEDTAVDAIDDVLREQIRLEPLSRDVFRMRQLDIDEGQPSAYYFDGNRTLVLGPIPNADETLTATCIMRPSTTTLVLDDALWDDYRHAIAAGARAHIRKTYHDWHNPDLQMLDQDEFERAMGESNLRRARGQTRHRPRVMGHYF
jgi:hypothetical protein